MLEEHAPAMAGKINRTQLKRGKET